jgi:hypothetical protein
MRTFGLWIIIAFLPTIPSTSSALPSYRYTEMVRSSPVTIDHLKFVAATEAQWQVGIQNIQLIITNPTAHAIAFPLFSTFGLAITSQDGQKIWATGLRVGTFFPKPILLRSGEIYVLSRPAVLNNSSQPTLDLNYKDGTGTEFSYSPFYWGGKYRLAFYVSPRPDSQPIVLPSDPPIWAGKGATKTVNFEISNP